jgi:hypothetical protein
MHARHTLLVAPAALLLVAAISAGLTARQSKRDLTFVPLFNGKDFAGWKVPEGDGGHWRVVDGVIDYDAQSQAGEKDLWTEKSFGDFVLRLDWRIKEVPFVNPNVFIVLPDGSHKKDEKGREMRIPVPDSDSGVYVRGTSKAQINIWNWPVGSGEVYGYRTDPKMPASVRAAVTPRVHADRHIGEWNTFEIEARGDELTVRLNGTPVSHYVGDGSRPRTGHIGLQNHHPGSRVQFRNIRIKRLD